MSNQQVTIPNPLNPGDTLTITVGTAPPPTGPIGWLGADALTGTVAIGQKVTVNSNAGPVRSGGSGSAPPINPQPNPVVGATVTVLAGPSGIFWQVQFPPGGTTPNPPNPPSGTLAAFVGAQGGGAESVGGRGGAVFEVTNTNDSGAGSLRAALQATGPRTVVFRVAGVISSLSRLQIGNPFVTIAGQTAPGSGITLGGPNQKGEQIFISTHDVVCRYLTYDGNNPNTPTGPDTGTVGFEMASGNVFNIVWDHCSARWVGNKVFPGVSNDAGNVHKITLQFCLVYEPNAQHPVGIGTLYVGSGGSGKATTDNDCHHCMFINHDHRLPLNQSGLRARWQNNIIFNWNQFAALSMGGCQIDYIGNKYIDGNLSQDSVHVFLAEPGNAIDPPGDWDWGDNLGPPLLYFLNNIGRNGKTPHAPLVVPSGIVNGPDQLAMTAQGWEGGESGGPPGSGQPMPNSWLRSTPLPAQTFPISDDTANLDAVIVPTVGNSQMLDLNGNWVVRRDSQDQRVIDQYNAKGPGQLFTGQFSPPPVIAGTPYPSSQHDGLSDAWKQAMHLDTSKPQNNVVMPDGYTALDWFLSGRKS
jgi:hypothetical protein